MNYKGFPSRRVFIIHTLIHRNSLGLLIALCLGAGLSGGHPACAQTPPASKTDSLPLFPDQGEKAPVDFAADDVAYDETGRIVTATGNVELIQNGRILKADKIIYNLGADSVMAMGNVVLNETTGDTYFGDSVQLNDSMKRGVVQGLRGLLVDGSRFTALQGDRVAGEYMALRQATYTPCEPCTADPSADPLWQLVAEDVTHDEVDKTISYKNARLEILGVPVAYTPYFSHPDGTVKRKSGFLTPSFGMDDQLGARYAQEYYWDIAPDKDATIGVMAMTEEAPVVLGEYRQRFDQADLKVAGSTTYSTRIDQVGNRDEDVSEDVRGHLFGEARWDMSDTWRSGARVQVTSDEQYLNQYDISSDDVLENELYAERFQGRNYGVVRALSFQDLRISQRNLDQPHVVPEVKASFVGAPNATLGGRWNAELSALGLYRDGSGQDVARTSLQGGWERKFTTGFGLVTVADILSRADLYQIEDRDITVPGSASSDSGAQARGFMQGNIMTSYPLVNRFDSVQWTVEPLVALTVVSDVNETGRIPNEDSRDVYLDSLKIFNSNRFPGYDRIEDQSRVTYGLRTGLFGYEGYRGEIFLGQSRRFEDRVTSFPEGSGLSERESDYVGMITSSIGDYLDLDYRFQVDSEELKSRRHELGSLLNLGPLSLYNQYFFADSLLGSDIAESREQIYSSAQLRIAENWALRSGARYDLGEDEGLREAFYGIDYLGQCMTFSVTGTRTLTRDSSGDSGTEIMFRIGLKNLGEFETSGFSVGGDDDSSNTSDDNDTNLSTTTVTPRTVTN